MTKHMAQEQDFNEVNIKAKNLLTSFGFSFVAKNIKNNEEYNSSLYSAFEVIIYRDNKKIVTLQVNPGCNRVEWFEVLDLVRDYIALPAYKFIRLPEELGEISHDGDKELEICKKASFDYKTAISFFKELCKVYGNKHVDMILARANV